MFGFIHLQAGCKKYCKKLRRVENTCLAYEKVFVRKASILIFTFKGNSRVVVKKCRETILITKHYCSEEI